MYRIGILGTENSHALAFAQILNGYNPALAAKYQDFRVVAVGGLDRTASENVAQKCGISNIVDSPEEMVNLVDAVMITTRDGKYHAPYASPFIKAGKPAFVDKPFTSNPAEALALVRLAKEKNVPLVGGSSVKLTDAVLKLKDLVDDKTVGGDVTAPVSLTNDYGNFWFYASHLSECCLEIFGPNPEWVWANRTDRGVTAIVHYSAFDVTNHFVENVYDYTGSVITPETVHFERISLDDIYPRECECFASMVRSGKMLHSYEQLIAPVFLMAAIEKAFVTGEKQKVESFQL